MCLIRANGRHGLWAGGDPGAGGYPIDHLTTKNLQISNNGDTGAKMSVNNWTDINSLFQSELICCHIFGASSTRPNLNIVMINPRFELGASDCNLKIDQANNITLIEPHFLTSIATGLPNVGVKIATDAAFNVGKVKIIGGRWSGHITAIDVVGVGAVLGVKIIDPFLNVVTTFITNANNKPVQYIDGPNYTRVSGGGSQINLDGAAGQVLTSKLDGNANNWLTVDNSTKRITLGNGTLAPDASIARRDINGAAGLTTLCPFSVQNTGAGQYAGSGSPEGSVSAAVGSTYQRTDGGAGTSFYVKESGTGNTGWVGK
jgi:hypothetical protein